MLQAELTHANSNTVSHQDMANAIRALSMDAVQAANSGHPGMPMGMADVATVLFRDVLKYNAADARWADRDRFVLSAGHGSMLLYALLYLTGYPDMTLDDIKNFRQMGAKTAGHPEYGHAEGIETTTGPLGQGFANAVGMATAEAHLAAEFGAEAVDHFTYVIAGDGCLMEGISQEAASLAGHLKLRKLIVLFDDNGITIDGPTSLSTSEDQIARFKALGWATDAVDGHNEAAIKKAILAAKKNDRPTLIACKTTIGYGAPTKAGKSSSHGSPLGADEIAGARAALGWQHAPFEIPAEILAAWRAAGARSEGAYQAWQSRMKNHAQRAAFERRMQGELPQGWQAKLQAYMDASAKEARKEATRVSSQKALEVLNPLIPELLGGSADLTGSNNTKTAGLEPLTAANYAGRYVYYGIREHAMAAAMNGMALHGGVRPYGATFLVFTDYCRPAIRLSALMNQPVIYVMTHDSIGLGEDGPTHQPVEHLAALRAIPHLYVMRPADAVETAECWALAVASQWSPCVLALSRQEVPTLRTEPTKENLCAKGAYILANVSDENPQIILIGTGTELSLCVEAAKTLREQGHKVRVVSMPCQELFDEQDASYREKLLPAHLPKIAVEAAIKQGWEKYLGEKGMFVGMHGFGASAPASKLYQHFNITAEAIVWKATALLK